MLRIGQPRYLQAYGTRCGGAARKAITNLAPHHHAHHFIKVSAGNHPFTDKAAIAQHTDLVADAEDFFHAVRDINNGDTTRLQRLHQAEQGIDLAFGQCRCRLIHDQQARIHGQCLGNFHHLLLADGQQAGFGFRIDIVSTQRRQLRRCLAPHTGAVDHAETGRLAAEEQVFHHRQLRNQVQFLMDDGNAAGLSLTGGADLHRLAINADGTAVAAVYPAENLHQRGFAGAVLPHQGVDFAAGNGKVDLFQHADRAKSLADALHDDIHGLVLRKSRRNAESHWRRECTRRCGSPPAQPDSVA